MSIRTLDTAETHNGITVSRVEITDDEDRRESWEMHCQWCDTFECGLTEGEAFAAADEHAGHAAVLA
jgi:hypothetical protein